MTSKLAALRTQILDLVAEYETERGAAKEFVPGESVVRYAGRVFGPEELVKATDAVLDFWLTAGRFAEAFERYLSLINRAVAPVLNRLVPSMSINSDRQGYRALFFLSLSVPFILGLDDFAGYIPLFNVINILGFSIGVFLGHLVLNILLFLSPAKTIKIVKNPLISFIGSLVFVGLGLWGFVEVAHLIGFEAHGV